MSEVNEQDAEKAPEVPQEETVQESPKESAKPAPRVSRKSKSDEVDPEPTGDAEDQIVLYVDHPQYWPGVGRLSKGYNLVPVESGKLWLDKGWARKASVKEVKEHFGA